ncbi:MAG TPA: 50S ribosomal protein L15 [Alphaproteobacteria bacterium]|nr:50S ribosomal protein L15 [Rhodospirillaceae bacterium]HRJ11824.1 50S ribosomal protein L15 [Alphaproteobacteria bacterium]
MKLNEIKDNKGARKSRMRIGRGIGSGKGKTGGRGGKGQTARSGVAIEGFEGGQTPLHRRLPKIGFNKPNRKVWSEVTLARLQTAIDSKKLDTSKTVDGAALKAAGVVRHLRDGVRLLGTGKLTAKIQLHLSGATASAIKAVEAAGGSVSIIEQKTWLKAPRAA